MNRHVSIRLRASNFFWIERSVDLGRDDFPLEELMREFSMEFRSPPQISMPEETFLSFFRVFVINSSCAWLGGYRLARASGLLLSVPLMNRYLPSRSARVSVGVKLQSLWRRIVTPFVLEFSEVA